MYKQISRAVSLLNTSASFYHFLSKQFGVMKKSQLHFRFLLDFDNSRIGVQFGNKLTLCNVNIALQTILSLRLCTAPAHD